MREPIYSPQPANLPPASRLGSAPVPPEAGQIYFERCRRIVDEARLAHEQLGEMLAQPSGVLRVSLPVDFAIAFFGASHGRILPPLSRNQL